MRVQRAFNWLLLPGVVIHEVAHALVVTLLPNVEVVAIDFTSHVEHRGRYTIMDSVLISYAPLLVNTVIAGWALMIVSSMQLNSVKSIGIAVSLSYIAFAAGMTAIPSWTDVTNPISISWRQLLSIKGIFVFPFVVVLFVFSVPWLVISYARKRSVIVYVLASVAYASVIALVAFGVIPIPSLEVIFEYVSRQLAL